MKHVQEYNRALLSQTWDLVDSQIEAEMAVCIKAKKEGDWRKQWTSSLILRSLEERVKELNIVFKYYGFKRTKAQ